MTESEQLTMIETAQRRFAPTVIGMDWNPDRHQIGISDRLRWNTQLVAIVRKRLGLDASLYQIQQILSVTLFEKTPILRALQASDPQDELGDSGKQLILLDF